MKHLSYVVMAMLAIAATTGRAGNAKLDAVLEQLGVESTAESLRPAPIPGFVEVTRGLQVVYVSVDGALLINGDILSVATETNLTEERRAGVRLERLRSIPADRSLVVPASTRTVSRIAVFTDLDCPYCERLHRQRDELARLGIEIRYYFYPRSGPGSASFEQAVAVWCSGNPLRTLDRAFDGVEPPQAACDNPVMAHYELARELDLKGTPAVINADGAIRYGLHTIEDILAFATE